MSDSNGTTRGGIGIVGVLTIVFIVLKLVGVVAWSWWWVLSPLWISWAGLIGVLAVGLGVALVSGWRESRGYDNAPW